MSIDKNKIAIETALEQERELKQELSFLQSYIKRLRMKSGVEIQAPVESAPVIKKNEIALEPVSDTINSETTIPEGYANSLSLVKKFILLLKHHKRFLHFREAAGMMIALDPSLGDPKKLAARISSTTTSIKGKYIIKYQVRKDNRQTYWGISDWLNKDGTIKKGHEYNEEFGSRGSTTESLFDF